MEGSCLESSIGERLVEDVTVQLIKDPMRKGYKVNKINVDVLYKNEKKDFLWRPNLIKHEHTVCDSERIRQ